MTENESRPGPASPGGHQPHQHTPPQYGPYAQHAYQQQAAPNPLFTPQPPGGQAPTALKAKPRKGGRVAMIVSATALGAALVGGVGGAAIVGLTTNSAAGATTSVSTPAANGQTVSNSTSGDVSAVAAKVTPSVVQINVTTGQGEAIGSGVILTSDGRILTNAHVVNGAQNVVITTSDGKKYQASVVGADTKADIAVVQAQNASGLTAASLGDSSKLVVGQEVVAIGSPGGLQNTVTTGIVSALNRNLSDIGQGEQQQRSPFSRTSNQSEDSPSYTAIQTDAAINQGNSGGALVDAQGNVIGINSALYSPTASANGSAGSVGIGFAIPINDAKKIVDQIVNN
ncbi:S1C family serine protease [Amycolatopsis sp.]|uniref:S1C family serine protease n=1 Tax=Amycolatopsis sp. TaxID=37632 RepID=UPI002D80DFF4|nr:trypsin-like peptidase domain-containing protein [Amycolatopsis sp.]HET6708012.1 trypsin-like peptidase domain-containing protein [Amycolatopsis sp.]